MILLLLACAADPRPVSGHGPIAPNLSGAALGEARPDLTGEQQATFARGLSIARHRFTPAEGLGPAFNVSFCVACHEKPTLGGAAGQYRNFFLTAVITEDGAYLPGTSAGRSSGVVRMYADDPALGARPAVDPAINLVAQRNPIPFYGVGLLAELPDAELLRRADPDDLDGDGISGRPNYDRGYVGRFGRKAQTVSIEGFIRGPLFNHAGITTDPLSEAQKAALPVDSSDADFGALAPLGAALRGWAQAAAPDEALTDADAAPDPELPTDQLFDLVSMAMLLGAPAVRLDLDPAEAHGEALFDELGCAACHTPRLHGPRGPLPVYADLLLHDMGEDLADGIEQGEATGREFRTQPLWGIVAVGPYLHDGRASTLAEAIALHGGEAAPAAAAWSDLSPAEQADLLDFLATLGGEDQASPGLLPPHSEIPAVGAWGGPDRDLWGDTARDFAAGRLLFDADIGRSAGLGAPRFNGDSCRACHFDPILGGAGPLDVNVMRHGIQNADGAFVSPAIGTVLHKQTTLPDDPNRPQAAANIFEARQTPPLFGLGRIEGIPERLILEGADPEDVDGDGISGRPSYTDGGRLGRFGWKAQVPTLEEFVRDAESTELGRTLPAAPGLTFGLLHDNDAVPDPEVDADTLRQLTTFLRYLAPPPRGIITDPVAVAAGEALFAGVGCADCHTPMLMGDTGPVYLYSDLLLHEILPVGAVGIEEASASMREFRTPPLWGLRRTAPYLHDGAAADIVAAIAGHASEGAAARAAFEALRAEEKASLLAFLESL